MPDWFANHFVHPGYAWSWTAAALVAAPIVIHLLNRLRYRKVRFAAMEFLLASQKRNKRRILIEQLLLLLARVALVLLAILLIGRFTADASVLNLFQEAKAHHVILLDDSGSMRERAGDETAFDKARAIVQRLAAEGARQTGTQKFTLLRLSRPLETVAGLGERAINAELVADLTSYLEDLECTVERGAIAEGLAAAQARLLDDKSTTRHLHVISDFRDVDWVGDKSVAATLKDLDAAEVRVNLVRTVADGQANLAVTRLTGDLQAAAKGVPVAFQVEVTNTGPAVAQNVRLAVTADEARLPLTLEFSGIPAGETAAQDFYAVFENANRHQLSVQLETDALDQDNQRVVALDVPTQIPVLVIDASPERIQGQYVVDAIADAVGQNRAITGVSAVLDGPDYLRRYPLDGFQSILLINVPQLPEDAVVALERYVDNGGGLAWFLGNLVQPEFYNERLYRGGEGIFPVKLAATFSRATVLRDTGRSQLQPTDHPLLKILTLDEGVLLQYVTINGWHPVETAWWDAGEGRPSTLEVVARLDNRAPLILEHGWGRSGGRIVTFLTAAGPLWLPPERGEPSLMWNNWASDENAAISFLVLQLELQKRIGRQNRIPPQRIVGEPIARQFAAGSYLPTVEITTPDNRATRIEAAPPGDATAAGPEKASNAVAMLEFEFRDTGLPGVYSVVLTRENGTRETSLFSYNVPPEESRLKVATNEQILGPLGETRYVEIREADAQEWLRTESPGSELRTPLLVCLLVLLLVELYLAYRFSHHPTPERHVAAA